MNNYAELLILLYFFYQVINFASPTSAGAECIDPNCAWVEQWYFLIVSSSHFLVNSEQRYDRIIVLKVAHYIMDVW